MKELSKKELSNEVPASDVVTYKKNIDWIFFFYLSGASSKTKTESWYQIVPALSWFYFELII